MQLSGPLVFGKFLRRPNRFLAICLINGEEIPCYIPNPGPMPDLLFPGVEVLLRHSPGEQRKTSHDLVCARHQGKLLSLDCRVPNWLLAELLPSKHLPPFQHYESVQTEPIYEGSRLDFLLQTPSLPSLLLEAKSSTHAENETGFFPRAVTHRGSRHLRTLMHAVTQGYRAAIVFIVQRADAKNFRPNDRIDPKFSNTLRQAIKHGVEAYAWTTQLDEKTMQIKINHSIPVDLDPPLLF